MVSFNKFDNNVLRYNLLNFCINDSVLSWVFFYFCCFIVYIFLLFVYFRDIFLVLVINCFMSFYVGFVIFFVLGFMVFVKGIIVVDVVIVGR